MTRPPGATLLVTGGAGYIGSHLTRMLLRGGYRVIVLDDLSTGFREALPECELVVGNCGDVALLDRVFAARRVDCVLHLAASTDVAESIAQPEKYRRNNLETTEALAQAMGRHGAPPLVFSSTAAVYGNPRYLPVDEAHPAHPINPYGQSKLLAEHALRDAEAALGVRSVVLRYFNVAGADPHGAIGDLRTKASMLVPRILRVAADELPGIDVYGDDFGTRDGTCVRDFIHVWDVCSAHLLAVARLLGGGPAGLYNLGIGHGSTVQEVIAAARTVTGHAIPAATVARREGDPAEVVADSSLARRELEWAPRYTDIRTLIEHAWAWQSGRHAPGAANR